MSLFRTQKQKNKNIISGCIDSWLPTDLFIIFIFIQNSFLLGRNSSKTSNFAVGTPFWRPFLKRPVPLDNKQECLSRGYSYWGVESVNFCFCGDEPDIASLSRPGKLATIVCCKKMVEALSVKSLALEPSVAHLVRSFPWSHVVFQIRNSMQHGLLWGLFTDMRGCVEAQRLQ